MDHLGITFPKQHPSRLFLSALIHAALCLAWIERLFKKGLPLSNLLDLPVSSPHRHADTPPERKKKVNLSSLSAVSSLFKAQKKKGYFSNEALRGIKGSAMLQNCAQQKLYLL